jgi:hypothetical protein
MITIGTTLSGDISLYDVELNLISLASLLRGPEFLIIIFSGFAFEEKSVNYYYYYFFYYLKKSKVQYFNNLSKYIHKGIFYGKFNTKD